MIDDDKPSLEQALAHHGVKGQKWGVRRGRGTTGVSRTAGAKIEKNQRLIRTIKDTQAGKKHKVAAAVGRGLVGKQQQNKNWNQSIKNLNAQNKRLKSGKATIGDKLQAAMSATVFDLVVSRTSK